MKRIDYKLLRSYLNLPKYDPGMTPISSGYLGGDYTRSVLSTIKSPTSFESDNTQALSSIAGNFTPMLELGKSLGKTWSALGAAKDASSALNTAQSTQVVASKIPSWAGVSTIENSPGYVSNLENNAAAASSSAKGAMVASRGVAALAALYGGYKSIADADKYGRSPISPEKLLDSAGQFNNENGAHLYSGIADTSDYLRDYNNAGMTSSITSGMTFGAGAGTLLGSLAGPAGSVVGGLIGTGIGALGGAITGWINRGKAKRKLHEAQENVKYAIAGYNRQSNAEARDQIIKNEYAQSHFSADEGLNLNSNKPNGRFGALELVIETNDDGKVINAYTLPWIPGVHEPRRDDYYGKAGDNVGIGGWKKDPKTGIPFTIEMAPMVQAFNSTNNLAEKDALGEMMKKKLNEQERTPRNNPSPYDMVSADQGKNMKKYNCGKGLKKYDVGDELTKKYTGRDALRNSTLYNLLLGTTGILAGINAYNNAKKMPTVALLAPVEDYSAMLAVNSMPITRDITPQKLAINDQYRYSQYAITNNPSLSSGQKMALLSQLHGDNMKAISDAYAKYFDDRLQMIGNKANAWINVANNLSSRRLQAAQEWINNKMKANAAKYNAMATAYKNIFTPIAAMAENANNNNWMLANLGLYEQDLSRKDKDLIAKLVKQNIGGA